MGAVAPAARLRGVSYWAGGTEWEEMIYEEDMVLFITGGRQ
jgi:hypothetical protein